MNMVELMAHRKQKTDFQSNSDYMNTFKLTSLSGPCGFTEESILKFTDSVLRSNDMHSQAYKCLITTGFSKRSFSHGIKLTDISLRST